MRYRNRPDVRRCQNGELPMVTRDHMALNYSGTDPSLPPPLCWTVPHANRALPTKGRVHRSGFVPVQARQPHLMADPTDPSTWQRPYRFT